MKKMITKICKNFLRRRKTNNNDWFNSIYNRYQMFSMIPKAYYIENLSICQKYCYLEGDVVECGVWKGGMMAGIAELLGNKRNYYLFDSFEGLPLAEEIDGEKARNWQQDTKSSIYYNNCTASVDYAIEAMHLAGIKNAIIVKGWFKNTLENFIFPNQIAILRLDADWYSSTKICLEKIYPFLAERALIIIDDYYAWEGCSKAVHDFLSEHQLSDRIHTSKEGVAYITKDSQR